MDLALREEHDRTALRYAFCRGGDPCAAVEFRFAWAVICREHRLRVYGRGASPREELP
jgi:hypothetical protein